VGIDHTFLKLVYGLHALMPPKYLLPMTNCVTSRDFATTKVLNIRLLELEKLEESRILTVETIGRRQWNHVLWAQNHYQTKTFSLSNHVFGFQKHKRNTHASSNNVSLDHT
jgi:hypothetical protein